MVNSPTKGISRREANTDFSPDQFPALEKEIIQHFSSGKKGGFSPTHGKVHDLIIWAGKNKEGKEVIFNEVNRHAAILMDDLLAISVPVEKWKQGLENLRTALRNFGVAVPEEPLVIPPTAPAVEAIPLREEMEKSVLGRLAYKIGDTTKALWTWARTKKPKAPDADGAEVAHENVPTIREIGRDIHFYLTNSRLEPGEKEEIRLKLDAIYVWAGAQKGNDWLAVQQRVSQLWELLKSKNDQVSFSYRAKISTAVRRLWESVCRANVVLVSEADEFEMGTIFRGIEYGQAGSRDMLESPDPFSETDAALTPEQVDAMDNHDVLSLSKRLCTATDSNSADGISLSSLIDEYEMLLSKEDLAQKARPLVDSDDGSLIANHLAAKTNVGKKKRELQKVVNDLLQKRKAAVPDTPPEVAPPLNNDYIPLPEEVGPYAPPKTLFEASRCITTTIRILRHRRDGGVSVLPESIDDVLPHVFGNWPLLTPAILAQLRVPVQTIFLGTDPETQVAATQQIRNILTPLFATPTPPAPTPPATQAPVSATVVTNAPTASKPNTESNKLVFGSPKLKRISPEDMRVSLGQKSFQYKMLHLIAPDEFPMQAVAAAAPVDQGPKNSEEKKGDAHDEKNPDDKKPVEEKAGHEKNPDKKQEKNPEKKADKPAHGHH
ncbi:hypothetical protein EXS70_01000 [Candidatus Peribacteria bacterium]|nr:hypothetical protein [Candidatus Peribacteria bacterium]